MSTSRPASNYRDDKPPRFAVLYDDPDGWHARDIDLAFGNGLTYHDPL